MGRNDSITSSLNDMFKISKMFTRKTDNQGTVVKENGLHESRKVILGLIFALAAVLKVSPARLAAQFAKNNAKEFADRMNAELDKLNEKAIAKLRDAINAPAKKAAPKKKTK